MDITTSVLTPNTHVVVLDLDGTLYNKSGMIGEMMLLGIGQWWRLLAERKTRKAFRGQYLGCEELFYSTYYRAIANRTAFSEKYISNWYQNTYMPMMVEVIRRWHQPMAWVVPFAKACHEKGVKVVVLSDYGHAKEKLQALGLDIQLFDWVVSAPELGGLKPAPQIMHHVADRMGVTPQQCLVIGDREDTDGDMARAVNAKFCLVGLCNIVT